MKMVVYSSKDIAVVIPTRDRPKSIRELLSSLAAQSVQLGRIIVVDSGSPVSNVLHEYNGILPLEYHRSSPGQIHQRKVGLSLLTEATPLVATIDDDLIFEPDSFFELLQVFNSSCDNIAGVGFNHRDAPPNCYFFWGKLFFMSSKNPGVVTLAGYNTSIARVTENLQTSWLGGGYTVWKLSVLRQFGQEETRTRWAVGEDVRFSYAVSKYYRLYVAHRAGVKESLTSSNSLDFKTAFFRGYKGAAAFYYLVKTNPELSRLLCVWMLMGRVLGKIFLGITNLSVRDFGNAVGAVALIARLPLVEFGAIKINQLLED